jgi:hypothetical protein
VMLTSFASDSDQKSVMAGACSHRRVVLNFILQTQAAIMMPPAIG